MDYENGFDYDIEEDDDEYDEDGNIIMDGAGT